MELVELQENVPSPSLVRAGLKGSLRNVGSVAESDMLLRLLLLLRVCATMETSLELLSHFQQA